MSERTVGFVDGFFPHNLGARTVDVLIDQGWVRLEFTARKRLGVPNAVGITPANARCLAELLLKACDQLKPAGAS